jgi:fructose-bisphosphate aldolase, class I
MDRMSKLMRNGKSLILAYDQGLEHGPTDFNEVNIDPSHVVEIARNGGFDAFVAQKGIARNYYVDEKVPLLLKLNGKTAIYGKEPVAKQNCSVEYAVKLGASAVGYTIYIGSAHESEMMAEFGRIQEEAHEHGIPAILWIYPRGEYVKSDTAGEMVAYAARAGLELGADAVKVKYSGDPESFRWAVKAAGRIPVYMAGGPKTSNDEQFLRQVSECMKAGASGVAVGRNVWQSEFPLRIAHRLNALVIQGKSLEDALKTE